jgi:hypothetical protein
VSADRNDGVAPQFAPLLESLLDTATPMQVQHMARRGRHQAACGEYGQTTTYASAVTCPACRAMAKRKDGRR